jgi:uncharacterized membrane protein SpoIIM required for sporulation
VNLERFCAERGGGWDELEALLGRARGAPERLGAAGARRFGALYRATAADLALARRAFPGDPLVRRLDALVRTARPVVYAHARPRRESFVEFVTRGYWQRVMERPWALAAAWALLLVPAALATAWGLDDPGGAIGVVPSEFLAATEPGEGDQGLTLADEAAFSSEVMTNNVQVTFLAFAGGFLACLGTAAVVVYNGLFLGAIVGIVFEAGDGARLVELVAPHGVLELSCISVTAAAGLRLGWTVVAPGPRRRLPALGAEARRAVEVLIGTVPWLVVAGLVEGFVTGSGLGLGGALAVGIGLAALYWSLAVWRGRAGAEPARGETAAQATPRPLTLR